MDLFLAGQVENASQLAISLGIERDVLKELIDMHNKTFTSKRSALADGIRRLEQAIDDAAPVNDDKEGPDLSDYI